MTPSSRVGLLLLNLGTPDSPDTPAVRRYLKEFLLDPRVIDIAGWKRQLLVRTLILPFRPKRSAEAYRSIWTEGGSPLLVHTQALAKKVQMRLGERAAVKIAMRYGNPSIASALEAYRAEGIDMIALFPLYPQYAAASTGSSVEAFYRQAARRWSTPFVTTIPPFYDDPRFIEALAAVLKPGLGQAQPEVVIFSYHGLPERQCQKTDDSGAHCLKGEDCCEAIVQANRNCYRAQCYATTRALTRALGLAEGQYRVSFQSRLGRSPWIRPYTDLLLPELARQGVRRVAICSPSFVADCLETLEELGIRGVESFREAGGETLTLLPCLNADDAWADAVAAMAMAHCTELAGLG